MSSVHHEDAATRRQALGEWLKFASRNAKAAVLLAGEEGLETHALYMTEQTMESATKGIARGAGKSHTEVYGHDYINLFLSAMDDMVTALDAVPYMNNVFSSIKIDGKPYDAAGQIQRMIALSGNPKKAGEREQEARDFFEKMLIAPPEEVKKLLDLVSSIDDKIDKTLNDDALGQAMTSAPFTVNLPHSGSIAAVTASTNIQLDAQVTRRMKRRNQSQMERIHRRKITYKALLNMITAEGVEHFRAGVESAGGKFRFPKENLVNLYDGSKAFVRLLLVGGLVWPHESYPRYPASPDAAGKTFEEAAKERQLGAQHYSDAVGVIRYIRELSAQAEKAVNMLSERYQAGALFPDWTASSDNASGHERE